AAQLLASEARLVPKRVLGLVASLIVELRVGVEVPLEAEVAGVKLAGDETWDAPDDLKGVPASALEGTGLDIGAHDAFREAEVRPAAGTTRDFQELRLKGAPSVAPADSRSRPGRA